LSDDLLAIIGCCILGLIAHGASRHHWLEWVLRVIFGIAFFFEAIGCITDPVSISESPWTYWVLVGTTICTGLLLFKPGRQLFSALFTIVNQIMAGRVFLAAIGKLQIPVLQKVSGTGVLAGDPLSLAESTASTSEQIAQGDIPIEANSNATVSASAVSDGAPAVIASAPPAVSTIVLQKATVLQAFLAERVFIPESIPHMNGLWIYVTCLWFLLTHTEPGGFQMPAIMIPMPVTFDQLFSYNFMGLIMLSVCGAGIFVARKPMEILKRLGLVKPSLMQVALGVGGIFVTFTYDYIWSLYTHGQSGMGYADKLSHYNEGTFTGGAAPAPALLVASATGLCAGLGEETLIRGALQPVFGLVPAAFMHGALHAQFSHAPLLILQVFGWSMMMGILRRYTNTTTTIITHVGYNFLSTFLFAFNP